VLQEKSLSAGKSLLYQQYAKLMSWADRIRRLGIRTNADQPDQAAQAVAFGAEGIGLCRTEHMFFGEGKIGPMREMILADDLPSRERALAKLLPLQRADFKGIFKAMGERPVTIRTLDPPLHEFLPHQEHEIQELAKEMGVPPERLWSKVESLHETNPMLGHRGCRLGITFPEITVMQARAILEAACEVHLEEGFMPHPEIMIPLVGFLSELKDQARSVRAVGAKVLAEKKVKIPFKVGTMIELPRAALVADQIAGEAEFFSYGTNDLTQTTMGMSRDDAGVFLRHYYERNILEDDPFQTLDTEGVGQLVAMGVQKGRATRPDLKVGICGEHGGDPRSITFCHSAGMNYVSCSPFRVPIARLAAAQAALQDGDKKKAGKARPAARKAPKRKKGTPGKKMKSAARVVRRVKKGKTGRRR
jgi:pyruvate,orthophosphate dikinase